MNSNRWRQNRAHWEQTLDADNLGREETPGNIEQQLALFETADVRLALQALEPLNNRLVVDLGGGLGLGAILLARRGARVVVTDLSMPRLKLARKTVARLGLDDRVSFVAAEGERLPFGDGKAGGLFTKSVLIHTRRDECAAECGRVLGAGGRAAFIEPLDGNPFVNLYRRLAAPRIWRTITSYFNRREIATVARGMKQAGSVRIRVRPLFFTAFFASVFQFAIKNVRLYRLAEDFLLKLDSLLFRAMPGLKKRCWFVVMTFSKE